MVIEETVNALIPVFVPVTFCAGLVMPVACGPNVKLKGEKLANGPDIPVPDRLTGWGLSPALSVILTDPWTGPAAVGANFTLIVQLPPGGTSAVQVFVCVKMLEFVATDTPLNVAVPTFVNVTLCAALVLPTFSFPNARPVGESETTVLERLPAFMNTLESNKLSSASAMANLIWFVAPALTFALAVSTTVRPFISVLNGAVADGKSLFR